MFSRKNNNMDYYENAVINRIYFEIEEINRKLKNLNNRLKRIEDFLHLSYNEEYNSSNRQ